jgi:hypothetical protein
MYVVHAVTVPEQKEILCNIPDSPRLQGPKSLPFLDALLRQVVI